MITKKEYMANASELHHDYWLQFTTDYMRRRVDSIKNKVLQSTDPYLNDIPLRWWDDLSRACWQELCLINEKINGRRSASLSCGVCAAKAHANTLRGLEIWEKRYDRL